MEDGVRPENLWACLIFVGRSALFSTTGFPSSMHMMVWMICVDLFGLPLRFLDLVLMKRFCLYHFVGTLSRSIMCT